MSGREKLKEIQHTEIATGRTYEPLVEAFEHELGYLIVKDAQAAAKLKHAFEPRFASGKDFPIDGR